MKLIQPNCRIQFTADDLQFIITVLGKKTGNEQTLVNLLTDPDTRDLILDDEALFHSLLEHHGCLTVSNHLYFYIIVRNVLTKSGIKDRAVADYVAELLSQYSMQENTICRVPGQHDPLEYFFEMLSAIQTADERTAFFIRAHIANHSLFLSGLFPHRIRSRAERGFPGLSYYEALGQTNFRLAGDHRLAARYELGPIFATLSEEFQTARKALNDMSERIVSLGDLDCKMERMICSALDAAGRN
ncbi:MAG: hypothetical protein ACO1QB_18605 [Verrucomicrobiales bacterium]